MSHAACHLCRREHASPFCAGPCACPVDGVDLIRHVEAGFCPHRDGPRFGSAIAPADWETTPKAEVDPDRRTTLPAPASVEERGRAAWLKLHAEGPGQGEGWLAEWEKLIPCGDCRRKYDELKAQSPPAFPLEFEWTWWVHDQVNAELQKAQRPTLEEARAIHAEGADRRGVEPASIDNRG